MSLLNRSIHVSSFSTFQVFECVCRRTAAGWQPGGLTEDSVGTGEKRNLLPESSGGVEGTAAGHPAAPPGAQTALVWVRRAAGTAAANGKGRSDREFQSTVIELLLCFYHAKPPELYF